MKKIILTLVLILGVFIVTQAQTRGANSPRKFKQEKRLPQRLKQRHKIRPFERRQRAEVRRVYRRHKMRKQSRTVMLQEQFNLYKVNAKQAA